MIRNSQPNEINKWIYLTLIIVKTLPKGRNSASHADWYSPSSNFKYLNVLAPALFEARPSRVTPTESLSEWVQSRTRSASGWVCSESEKRCPWPGCQRTRCFHLRGTGIHSTWSMTSFFSSPSNISCLICACLWQLRSLMTGRWLGEKSSSQASLPWGGACSSRASQGCWSQIDFSCMSWLDRRLAASGRSFLLFQAGELGASQTAATSGRGRSRAWLGTNRVSWGTAWCCCGSFLSRRWAFSSWLRLKIALLMAPFPRWVGLDGRQVNRTGSSFCFPLDWPLIRYWSKNGKFLFAGCGEISFFPPWLRLT